MIARRIETIATRLGLFFASAMAVDELVGTPKMSIRPAAMVDIIDEARWLIEAARAATYDPDGPPAAGTRVLLDVIDDKLKALAEAVLPAAT